MKTEWVFIIAGSIEVVLRILPTKKNLSILDTVQKVVNFILPNKSKDGSEWSIKKD